jgi:hypothetical protein
MMLLNVGGPTSTIQLIICVVPIDTIDGSDRLGEWLCAGLVREHDSGAVNLHGSADLVGTGEPSLDQPVEPIGFTILIC